jgi:mono/diheme cytochrome c family protein
MKHLLVVTCAILAIIPAVVTGQAKKSGTTYPDLTVSGPELYRIHCASCHGVAGKGDGPAAETLKHAPPDLTTISQRNKGKFPDFRIEHIIDGQEVILAHGTREMPIWGDLLPQHRDDALLKLREHNLTEYVRSLQR